jgi:enoyl-CoA hydratase/carnithine racemase
MMTHVTVSDGLALLRFDNPPHNVFSDAAKSELTEAFRSLAPRDDVRVLLFTTEGPQFSYGADLREFPRRIAEGRARAVWRAGHQWLNAVSDFPHPTVVAVQGRALGAGAELVTAFDIRVFADDAVIGWPEVHRAVFPGNGGLERLLDLVGPSTAMELVLTGRTVGASEARRLGLATMVVSAGDLQAEARKIAETLLRLPGITIQAIKRAIQAYVRGPATFDPIGEDLFVRVHETEDIREAILAWESRRPPAFRHC